MREGVSTEDILIKAWQKKGVVKVIPLISLVVRFWGRVEGSCSSKDQGF
jgi:hypothetical protein